MNGDNDEMEDEDDMECQNLWSEVFDKLDALDHCPDGQIRRQALVKWMSELDLQHRIDFEVGWIRVLDTRRALIFSYSNLSLIHI